MSTTSGLSAAQTTDAKGASGEALPDYAPLVDKLRRTFKSGKTKPLAWRRQQLSQLRKMFVENWDEWVNALHEDLGRHKAMCVFGDLNGVLKAVDTLLDKLDEWTAKRPVPTQLELFPGKAWQQVEPKGVVLNIAPWNFPVELIAHPLAYILAAGNCCVLKPSEVSKHVEGVFSKLVPRYLDPEAVACVTGGVATATALLKEQWDHIMYTGNGAVGKVVMSAAAKHLTPVTLELGGKSPCVVDKNCNLALAAKRILNGKTFNCGQICLAPDYVLLHKSHEAAFFEELKKELAQFYPKGQQQDESYARIINENHFKRLKGLLADHGGEEVIGGLSQCSEKDRPFVTTVVKNPSLSSKLMQEEVFGPILPVVVVNDIEEAIEIINARDKPLGLYVFSNNQSTVDSVLTRCPSGGVTINDFLFHIVVDDLPFGGVGPSGIGVTHGRAGFDEFCHLRSVLHRGNTSIDLLGSARYPPFDESKYKLLTKMTLHAPKVKAVLGVVAKVGLPLVMGAALYHFW